MKRAITFVLLVVILLSILAFSLAQPQSATEAPTSAAAIKALASYKEEVHKLDEDYARRLDALRQQYVKELDKARKASLEKDDLEEAQRLLAEKRRVESERPQPGVAKGLVVLCALIGIDDRWLDITPQVRRLVKNSQLHCTFADLTDVYDVAPGRHKSMMVAYTLDGKAKLSITQDDQPFDLPKK